MTALFQEMPRETIYHYTSWEGFEGILRSSTFHAKHYRDMDDQLEFQHADQIILQAARDLFRQRTAAPSKTVLQRLIASYSANKLHARPDFDVYIACFCVAGPEEPHLWRSQYGRNCEGFCLGIRPLVEPHALEANKHVNGGVMRVVYEPQAMQQKVTAQWKRILDALDSSHEKNSEEIRTTAVNGLYHVAVFASMALKHERFESEHEWRQCIWVTPESRLPMWTSGGKRYAAWPLRKDRQRVALDSVHVGRANGQAGVTNARELLVRLGYADLAHPCMPPVSLSKVDPIPNSEEEAFDVAVKMYLRMRSYARWARQQESIPPSELDTLRANAELLRMFDNDAARMEQAMLAARRATSAAAQRAVHTFRRDMIRAAKNDSLRELARRVSESGSESSRFRMLLHAATAVVDVRRMLKRPDSRQPEYTAWRRRAISELHSALRMKSEEGGARLRDGVPLEQFDHVMAERATRDLHDQLGVKTAAWRVVGEILGAEWETIKAWESELRDAGSVAWLQHSK